MEGFWPDGEESRPLGIRGRLDQEVQEETRSGLRRDEIRKETEYVLGIVFLLFCGQLIGFYCLSICSNSSASVYLAISVIQYFFAYR